MVIHVNGIAHRVDVAFLEYADVVQQLAGAPPSARVSYWRRRQRARTLVPGRRVPVTDQMHFVVL